MNIVFGGSFNPPTKAHYLIAKQVIDIFKPDNFIFLPTGLNYGKNDLKLTESRLEMLNILKNKLTGKIIISELEYNKKIYIGTLASLNELSKDYDDIYFLMGADNFIQIETWINYQELLKKYNFIVFGRNNINIEEIKNKYKINDLIYINFDLDISSTTYRTEKKDSLLLPEVLEYIKNNNLY